MSPFFYKKKAINDYFKDIVVTKRYSIMLQSDYQREKIVILKHPFENRLTLKLIVGLGGDWIKERNTDIYHKIPDGYCWVEDYKNVDDSNLWGPVK